jgi:hypothetical protein
MTDIPCPPPQGGHRRVRTLRSARVPATPKATVCKEIHTGSACHDAKQQARTKKNTMHTGRGRGGEGKRWGEGNGRVWLAWPRNRVGAHAAHALPVSIRRRRAG